MQTQVSLRKLCRGTRLRVGVSAVNYHSHEKPLGFHKKIPCIESENSMAIYSRTVNVEMDWLDKTSFEIRGTLNDNAHQLAARFVISYPDFMIRDATAEITRMPYPGYCTGSVAVIGKFIGLSVGRGFRKRAGEIVGGAESCNHLHTLITNMAACAFQMNYVAAKQHPEAAAVLREVGDDQRKRREMVLGWMPQLRNTCYVFSEKSDALFELTIEKKADDTAANTAE